MLVGVLSSPFRARAALQLENLALRHQIGVLPRSVKKRPRLTAADRILWAWLGGIWSDWRSAVRQSGNGHPRLPCSLGARRNRSLSCGHFSHFLCMFTDRESRS